MRPVSVTTPAPVITPRIPSNGLFESPLGIAAAAVCATRIGLLPGTAMEEAIIHPSVACADSDYGGEPGSQLRGKRRVVERNLDWHPLDHFREIAGRVIRRQQCELGSTSRCDLDHSPLKYLVWINVDANLRWVADFDVGQLRLAIICRHPPAVLHKCHRLRSGTYKLSRTHLTLTDSAVGRCQNSRVAQIHSCDFERGFLGVQVCDKLYILRFKYGFASPLSLCRRLVATKQSTGLRQVRITAGKLRSKPFVIGDGCFDLLLGCG